MRFIKKRHDEKDDKETIERFNRVSKMLAICCILLLVMGCFVNGYMMVANCKEVNLDLIVSIFLSLIITFMGSYGLGYYYSFKTLQHKTENEEK